MSGPPPPPHSTPEDPRCRTVFEERLNERLLAYQQVLEMHVDQAKRAQSKQAEQQAEQQSKQAEQQSKQAEQAEQQAGHQADQVALDVIWVAVLLGHIGNTWELAWEVDCEAYNQSVEERRVDNEWKRLMAARLANADTKQQPQASVPHDTTQQPHSANTKPQQHDHRITLPPNPTAALRGRSKAYQAKLELRDVERALRDAKRALRAAK